MVTDVLSISSFFRQGKHNFALASISFIVGALFLQALWVGLINLKRPKSVVLKELLIVLTCMRPAIDAYKVASGVKAHSKDTMDTKSAATGTKVAEM